MYRLHYSLTLGRNGSLALGVVALLWLVHICIAWVLTLPHGRFSVAGWRRAFGVRGDRVVHDLHRAGGLWLLPVLAVLAATGVYYNLNAVFEPVLKTFTTVTLQPWEEPPLEQPNTAPEIDGESAIGRGRRELERRGVRVDGVAYFGWYAARDDYLTGYYTDRDLARDRPGALVYVAGDGSVRHTRLVGTGTAGDRIIDWQFALHSGQILGFTGRLLVTLADLATAMLAVTGMVLWLRRRYGGNAERPALPSPPAADCHLGEPFRQSSTPIRRNDRS